jgi:mgtE-like transporter
MHTGEINLVEFKNIYKDPIIKKNKVVSIVQTLNISFLIGLIGYIIGKAFGFEMMPFQDLIIISMSTAILANIILRHYTIFIATKSFERGWDPDNINTPLIAAFGDLITIPILFVVSIFCSFLREYYIIYTVVPFVLISASILSLIYGLNKKNLKETIIQSLPALTICIIITILSGIILEYNIQMIAVVYLVILMATPSFSTWGGNLGGIFASRMTSSLYTGITTKIRFIPSFDSVKDLFPYIFLSVCLSLVLSIVLHTISFIFGVSSPGFSNLLYICVITGLAITLISLLISYLLTYLSWQFGIDPDNMVIPLIASIMDVIGTACLITSLNIVCI